MVDMTKDILSDAGLDDCTKYMPRETAKVTVEVEAEEGSLLMKCIVDIDAEVRVPLDKAKLSRKFKLHDRSLWNRLTVEKRALD